MRPFDAVLTGLVFSRFTTLNVLSLLVSFLFKHKTAYEMRISDWSSDVCSSDLYKLNDADVEANMRAVRQARQNSNLTVFSLHNHEPGNASETPSDFEKGRASCRERVWKYVKISVVAVSLKKKYEEQSIDINPQHNRTTRSKQNTIPKIHK